MSMKPLPLERLLQSQGFGSRKDCRYLIESGAVRIAGEAVTEPGLALAPAGLRFCVDGEEWLYREHLYLALNKPPGYECSRKPSHHPAVLSLLPPQFRNRNVQPVGRLDHDTTGLLLLSDDGAFIHAHSSPRRRVPKRYLATTAEPVDAALVAVLLAGVQLSDEPAPLAATHCRQIGERQLELSVAQGKYHQVKRMLAAAGNHCAALARTHIGGLALEALALLPGRWCHLDEAALAALAGSQGDTTADWLEFPATSST